MGRFKPAGRASPARPAPARTAGPRRSVDVGGLKSALKSSGGGLPAGGGPAMIDLQGAGGNQLVQRLVSWSRQGPEHWAGGLPVVRVPRRPPRPSAQRQPAGGGAGGGGAGAGAPAIDPVEQQAKVDLPVFQAGTYSLKNHTVGSNGKFDVKYQPLLKRLDIDVKVKFDFKGKGWNVINRATSSLQFISQAQGAWTAKHQIGNVRAPKSVWSAALDPVTVNVRVRPVTKNQHFIVRFHKKVDTAQVFKGVADLYKGDLDQHQELFNPETAAGELARVKRIDPSPILFDHDSAVLKADFVAKLDFLATYLKRINNPPFVLDVKGFASSVGPTDYNKKLAEKRAKAVEAHLQGAGLTNHTVSNTAIGEVPGGNGAPFRKAVIHTSIPAGWKNTFSTVPHEFGHMLGLGDEYGGKKGQVATHHALVAKHFGQAYADQTVKRNDVASAGIMHFGEEVRIHHYVTFWDALAQATAKAAVPVPPFSHNDWKLIG